MTSCKNWHIVKQLPRTFSKKFVWLLGQTPSPLIRAWRHLWTTPFSYYLIGNIVALENKPRVIILCFCLWTWKALILVKWGQIEFMRIYKGNIHYGWQCYQLSFYSALVLFPIYYRHYINIAKWVSVSQQLNSKIYFFIHIMHNFLGMQDSLVL